MEPTAALTSFLERALIKRRERYLEFVARPKARRKFLAALPADLERCLDCENTCRALPEAALNQPALLFSLPDRFGVPISSLGQVVESSEDGCLAVSDDGRYGLYRPARSLDTPVEALDVQFLFNFAEAEPTPAQ